MEKGLAGVQRWKRWRLERDIPTDSREPNGRRNFTKEGRRSRSNGKKEVLQEPDGDLKFPKEAPNYTWQNHPTRKELDRVRRGLRRERQSTQKFPWKEQDRTEQRWLPKSAPIQLRTSASTQASSDHRDFLKICPFTCLLRFPAGQTVNIPGSIKLLFFLTKGLRTEISLL